MFVLRYFSIEFIAYNLLLELKKIISLIITWGDLKVINIEFYNH